MKKIFTLITVIALTFSATASLAMIPPKYLSVPKWQKCVSHTQKSTAEFVCLPMVKPKGCPSTSWKALLKGKMIPYCPKTALY